MDNYRHKGLRKQLADLLGEKGIWDKRVLEAIARVPRHRFLDSAFVEHAYEDKALPIGKKQTISQPYTVAYMTQALEVEEGSKVLEIGTGSGYQASILAQMKSKVYSVERHAELSKQARAILTSLNYKVRLRTGDGSMGWPTFAPYNRIIVTAGSPDVPESLKQQLAPGGIMVIPVGSESVQTMHKVRRNPESGFETEKLDTFRFVPLQGSEGWH